MQIYKQYVIAACMVCTIPFTFKSLGFCSLYQIDAIRYVINTVCDSPNSSLTTIILQDFLNFLRVQKLKQFWAASPVATVQVKVGKCQVKHTICDFQSLEQSTSKKSKLQDLGVSSINTLIQLQYIQSIKTFDRFYFHLNSSRNKIFQNSKPLKRNAFL